MRIIVVALAVLAALAGAGCPSAPPPPDVAPAPSPAPPTSLPTAPTPPSAPALATPDDLFARRPLTFVLGTAGDDGADRQIATQVAMVQAIFDGATSLADDALDVTKGLEAWPQSPVVYGGPHVNSVMARLAPVLPFELGPGRLVLGGRTFTGDDLRLIALVPARAADARGPAHPAFVLYAGTGTPGIAEINAVRHGADPILVADAFGPLVTGRWITSGQPSPSQGAAAGSVSASLGAPNRRIAWRAVTRQLEGDGAAAVAAPVRVMFPEQLAPAADESAVVDACMAGLAIVVKKLAIERPSPVDVYVYPDRASKKSLTGDEGDGHAIPAAHALHVVVVRPPERMVPLLAHEGTHVLALDAWGLAGMPLMGEGLAVWVAGAYGGKPLAEWTLAPADRPTLDSLRGPGFRRVTEAVAYPIAGDLIDGAVTMGGLARVRDYLYGASVATWPQATRASGLLPEMLEAEVARRLTPRPPP
ncbi:MAG: hypothetical protein U1F43_00995 [Myxococcota bacterium]